MALLGPALEIILKNEGGLVSDANDPGQVTNMGISLRFLKSLKDPARYGIYDAPIDAETIKSLTLAQVTNLYRGEFWLAAPFGNIEDQSIATYLMDSAVNMGIATAIKCCQRAIWAVWGHYLELPDDGILGHDTLMWIERCKPDQLLSALRSERAGEYRLIVQKHPEQHSELEGWLSRAYGQHP